MRKFYFLFLLLAVSFLSGCGGKTAVAPADPNDNILPEDTAIECEALCADNIQSLCREEIESAIADGANLENSILDESYCQLACEAEWNESTFDCVDGADDCAQFINTSPYCLETEIDDEEALLNNPQPGNCDKACRNYAKCAAYGDDVRQADLDAAYESCNEICAAWTDKTRDCVANTSINKASDCAAQSACVLPELKNMMR